MPITVQSQAQPSTSEPTRQQASSPQVTSHKSHLPTVVVAPQAVRPHPKGKPRISKKGRAKGKSRVLTDTPEKLAIEEEKTKKLSKKNAPKCNIINKLKRMKKRLFKKPNIDFNESSEDDNQSDISSGDINFSLSADVKEIDDELNFKISDLHKGDCILVKINTKKTTKYIVAHLVNIIGGFLEIRYFKKIMKNKFKLEDDAVYEIDVEDVVAKLPNPDAMGGSARQREIMSFGVDFQGYLMD